MPPLTTQIDRITTHADERGTLFEPLSDAGLGAQKNVHVVLTRPGEVRGNHVHLTAVETTSVVGPCRVRLRETEGIRDVDVPRGEVWRFTIPPGVAHAFRNTGDALLVLVSFSTRVHDAGDGDTRREVILE